MPPLPGLQPDFAPLSSFAPSLIFRPSFPSLLFHPPFLLLLLLRIIKGKAHRVVVNISAPPLAPQRFIDVSALGEPPLFRIIKLIIIPICCHLSACVLCLFVLFVCAYVIALKYSSTSYFNMLPVFNFYLSRPKRRLNE